MNTLTFDMSRAMARPTSAARSQVTLLLVDDDAILRKLISTVLTLSGYSVVSAPDGPTALAIAENIDVAMLITDFQMPGMDGCTLARTLTERQPFLPVLVVSGSNMEDLPAKEIAQRSWNFLAKPLDNERLLRIIDRECLRNPAAPLENSHQQSKTAPYPFFR